MRVRQQTCNLLGAVDWIEDRLRDLTNIGSGTWLAVAAWAAVALGVAVLIYANRQLKRNRELSAEQLRPHVTAFMERNGTDWHIVELVVRNFGNADAHDLRFAFFNWPTVAQYEHGVLDGMPEIVELQIPQEMPILAPGQEWRTVWDSDRDRAQLGDRIESRFVGSVTYYDRPADDESRRNKRRTFQSKVILDWNSLQPAPRLELLTSHDLAKRERQKLELLRSLLTYYEYASKEKRADVLQAEIKRMNDAMHETQDRWRSQQQQQRFEEQRRFERRFEQPQRVEQPPRIEQRVEPPPPRIEQRHDPPQFEDDSEHPTTTIELPLADNNAAGRHHAE